MTSFLAVSFGFFLLGILLNALFSGYEIGFISADRTRIRHLAEEEKEPRAIRLLAEIQQPEKMLITVLVGTNISVIFGAYAITSLVRDEFVASLIAAPMFLVFGEIVPKSIFRRHPNVLALSLLPMIRVFEVLLAPLVVPTLSVLRGLRRATGHKAESLTPVLSTEEDLRHLIDESAARGSIERDEQEMIHSVMDLPKKQAKEIMVPRIQILAIPADATRMELVHLFQTTGCTRIPIFRGTLDEIIGVATAFDVLLDTDPANPDVVRFAKPVIHVPDTKPVDELLHELRESPTHVAIATDEYGGTDGMITLEDVLEEIFGEIRDEHDREESQIHRLGPNSYVVDAQISLHNLSEVIGLPVEDDEVETFGGWIMRRAGRIPLQGESIKHGNLRVTILEGRQNQIAKARLDVIEETPQANEGNFD